MIRLMLQIEVLLKWDAKVKNEMKLKFLGIPWEKLK